jgi:hypothetical protein
VIHPAAGDRRYANEIGDLFRATGPAEWVRRFRSLEKLRVLRLIHAAPAMEVRYDDAGIDGVDADAVRREIQRGDARQLIDGGFADRVRRDAGKGAQPATLDTFTTAPRRLTSDDAASRINRKGARTLTAIIASQPSSVVSATLPDAITPAALTRASMPPSVSTARFTMARGPSRW